MLTTEFVISEFHSISRNKWLTCCSLLDDPLCRLGIFGNAWFMQLPATYTLIARCNIYFVYSIKYLIDSHGLAFIVRTYFWKKDLENKNYKESRFPSPFPRFTFLKNPTAFQAGIRLIMLKIPLFDPLLFEVFAFFNNQIREYQSHE